VRGGQTKSGSAVEIAVSTSIGYAVSVAAQAVIYPAFGISVAAVDNFKIAAAFTAISFARGYVVRRLFERMRR
jgi:hypothetical protein